jgi:hypothetical protein
MPGPIAWRRRSRGSTDYTAASIDPVTFTIAKAGTITTLALSSTSATLGDTVTLTATVAYEGTVSGNPGGTVSFYADSTLLGTATLDSNGVATLNVSSLAIGVHNVIVAYGGSGNAQSSGSASQALVINHGGDFVWSDDNSNGIQDDGESGVSGVTVNLLDQDGNTVASTTTDSTGHYHFTGISAGTYQLQFIAPDGTQFTKQAQGTEPTLDSDVDASGLTAFFTVGDDPAKLGFDAGLVSA